MKVITPITYTDAIVTGAPTWSRGSAAAYYDVYGVLKFASNDVPRMTYTPSTRIFEGLLVEGTATNLALQSETLQTTWGASEVTITTNSGIAPTATTVADKLVETTNNAEHLISQTITGLTNNGWYIFSIYAKASDRNIICLEPTKGAGSTKAWFNLNTGAVGTVQANASAAIQAIGSGWYRLSVRIQLGVESTSILKVYVCSADNSTSYTGTSGYGLFAYGAQFEASTSGGTMSSYIQTTTVAATRASDTVGTYNGVPETDHSAWATAVSYTVGARVILASTHKIYESVTAHTSAATNAPATTSEGLLNWGEVSATNRWKMFDTASQTVTSNSTEVFIVLRPGIITSLAVLGMSGSHLEISMLNTDNNTVVFEQSVLLDESGVTDWYDYFFTEYVQKDTYAITDEMPVIGNNLLAVRVISAGTAQIGTLAMGKAQFIGTTQIGASVGIIDYSRKETNTFGITSFTQRGYSKRNSIKLFIDNQELNKVFRILTGLRATPAVWVGTSDSMYDTLIVYGFYKDFSIDIAYNLYSYCSVEIEGLA